MARIRPHRLDPVRLKQERDKENARRRERLRTDPAYAERIHKRDREIYRSRPANWIKRARLRKYKISPQEWDILFDQQGSVCAICRSPSAGWKHNTWHTDHSHKTGEVRGILCTHCNHMLGASRDNPVYLREGAKYLEERE